MEQTLFYVFGITLVASALALAALGLWSPSFPGSRGVLAAVVAYFAALVAATTTFAVLQAAQSDERQHNAEAAAAAHQQEAAAAIPTLPGTGTTSTTTTTQTTQAPAGGGETLKVASPADGSLSYQPSKLTAKAGKVTIDYNNPSPVSHSIAIESPSGTTVASTNPQTDTTMSVSADLTPGTYTYYCTVPGHRQAGMEGTLTVK